MNVASEGGANAEGDASGKKKGARRAKLECQGKPPGTEAVSAEVGEALAEGEDGRGYFGEGEVLGWAGGALLPIKEQLSVAVGEAGGWIYVEGGEGLVDPGGGAFEFGIGADWRLVDDEVCHRVGVRACWMRPLGAVFLVGESGSVAELLEYLGHGFAFGDDGFGFDADLVAGGVDGVLLVGKALVCEGAEAAVLAQAEDLFAGAEIAVGSVVEGIVLEGAGSDEVEAELGKAGLERFWIWDGKLEFDLRVLHG
jgi:hypothetical protein